MQKHKVDPTTFDSHPGYYPLWLKGELERQGVKFMPQKTPFDIHEEPALTPPYEIWRDIITGEIVVNQ
jgi:hypothetical protein